MEWAWWAQGWPAHHHKAQGDGLMYRASRAQHSIPEQQHYVDKGVVQGGWGQEHVFLSERNGLNWRAVLLMNVCIVDLMHVYRSAHRRLNSPPL